MTDKNTANLMDICFRANRTSEDKALAWKTAIGLQDVDGLTPSAYLLETAKRHIDGDISIDDVRDLLDSYYEAKTSRTTDDDKTEEADKVSANITKLLNEQTFSFSPAGLAAIHGRIFDGVFKFAGRFRDCNISKREWVLRGESVLYVGFAEIKPALEHDFNNEKEFSYKNLMPDDMIKHFVKFISGICRYTPSEREIPEQRRYLPLSIFGQWAFLSVTGFLLNTLGTSVTPLCEPTIATMPAGLSRNLNTLKSFSVICFWEKITNSRIVIWLLLRRRI